MIFSILQEAGSEAVEAAVAPVSEELSFSLISMAAKGGWLMIVLAILSVIAIYIFGKKWWAIRRAGKIDKNFIKDVDDYLLSGKVRSARALCRRSDSPIARMIEKGVERIDKPLDDIRIAVENVANVEVAKLEGPSGSCNHRRRCADDRIPRHCARHGPGILQYGPGRQQH